MELTDRKIAGIKPTGKREEIKDGKWPLWLIIQQTGTKSFQWRGLVDGRDKRVTLGRYGTPQKPGLTLFEARRAALGQAAAAQAVSNQNGPNLAASRSVKDCFGLYMEREGDSRANADEKWRMWRNDIAPHIGDRPIGDVERLDLTRIISAKYQKIVAEGGNGVGSNRLHGHLSRFFNWCIDEGWDETHLALNPMVHVKKIVEEKPRDRVLSERELRWLFAALTKMSSGRPNDQSAVYARGIEFTLRNVTRRSETFDAEWQWLTGNRFLIPNTKNTLPHLLWLHPSAMVLLGDRQETARPYDRIFPVHSRSMSKPMRRLRLAMNKLALKDGFTLDFTDEESSEHWSLRDLRTTGTTTMAGFLDAEDRQLIPPHVRDRLLNHKDVSVRGRHYDFHELYAEKKAALKIWNEWLDDVRSISLFGHHVMYRIGDEVADRKRPLFQARNQPNDAPSSAFGG